MKIPTHVQEMLLSSIKNSGVEFSEDANGINIYNIDTDKYAESLLDIIESVKKFEDILKESCKK